MVDVTGLEDLTPDRALDALLLDHHARATNITGVSTDTGQLAITEGQSALTGGQPSLGGLPATERHLSPMPMQSSKPIATTLSRRQSGATASPDIMTELKELECAKVDVEHFSRFCQ